MTHRDKHTVSRMCQTFGVSRSGYYDWLKAPESNRSREDRYLLNKIREIHEESNDCYGSPKVCIELTKQGISHGHNRVARIMRENGIKSKVVRKFKPYSKSIRLDSALPNLLDRQFTWEKPNQAWVTDITYIPTDGGWSYLCTFLDLFNREVVGWSVATNMKTDMVLQALSVAIARRKPEPGLLIHSDQGSQFGSDAYRKFLKDNGFIQSMSRRGNCWDNACIESFFRLIKVEALNDYRFRNMKEVRYAVFKYIEYFYNRKRIHSSLGFMTPVEYVKKIIA
jgi:putative transposase